MAKGKKGKKKKDKKKKVKEDKEALTEVDKEFYELQITDLNRKLARLRSRCAELELSNEQLNANLSKEGGDKNDVIDFLNQTLEEKEALIEELQERIQGLLELREQEAEAFRAKIDEMEKEFKSMQLQLTSEIKLLSGKLNALDEFRVQRDELMDKFTRQEAMMEEQEKRHARELYEVERKFIISKDRLKKEMEHRLLQLSIDFQQATEARITSTTHRVIRENIAINNELDLMLSATRELTEENEKMRKRDQDMRLTSELHEREKMIAIKRSDMQKKLINRLSVEHAKMLERVKELSHHQGLSEQCKRKLEEAEQRHYAACAEARKLREKLSICADNNDKATARVDTMRAYVNRMQAHISAVVRAVKDSLEIEESEETDEAYKTAIRDNLLCVLLEILTQYDYCNLEPPPHDTGSLSTYQASLNSDCGVYRHGDLGLIPRGLTDVLAGKATIESVVGSTLLSMPQISQEVEATTSSTYDTPALSRDRRLPRPE